MDKKNIQFELLTTANISEVRAIHREEIGEDFVGSVDTGVRPIALGCHKDNHKAEKFYIRHGFKKTDVMEGNDYYYLRYPSIEM